MLHPRSSLTLSLLILLLLSALCFASLPPTVPPAAPVGGASAPLPVLPPAPPQPQLSAVTQRGYLGLRTESQESQRVLLENARTYVRYQRHSLTSASRKKLIDDCKSVPATYTNPFCVFLIRNDTDLEDTRRSKQKERTGDSRFAQIVVGWLKKAELEKIKSLSERDLRSGLKKIKNLTDLEAIKDKVVLSESCAVANFAALLGNKAEEFLPSDEARSESIALYKKATSCATLATDNVLRSRLRLALLSIWNNQYAEALPQLQSLALAPETSPELRSRALFWEGQCGIRLKKPELTQQSKKTLLEKFPFSLHSLLVQMDDSDHRVTLSSKFDSPIQFRVEGQAPLNARTRATEALFTLQENKYARDALETIDARIEKSPAKFRLYVAALHGRLDEAIKRFRLLSAVFKDDPSLISKTSLELFYPQKITIAQNMYTSRVDGMLLLSLIRQESAFNTRAKSSAGAIGLMQVMPYTARRFFRFRNNRELYNPTFNLKVGSRYFSGLLSSYGGDAELALAAYNAGPKRVEQWLKRYPVKDRVLFLDLIPFKETRDYVSSIARNYFWYVSLYSSDAGSLRSDGRRTLGKVFSLFRT